MHSITTEPNTGDHRGHSYPTWVTKTGRLINASNAYEEGKDTSKQQRINGKQG